MSDLINRQDAIDAMEDSIRHSVMPEDWYKGASFMLNIVADMPSAQPERKTGRWIDRGYMKVGYHCSECGGYVIYQTDYCPHCGAKMEVEHEGGSD